MTQIGSKNLGRGLSAFLDLQTESDGATIVKIAPQQIRENPYQPRVFFDEEQLQALAQSIKRKGVLQPILVQKISDDAYQLVAGERRLRASKIAGLKEIPAIVTDFTREEQLEVAILENVQRENLNPLEEAEGYQRLIAEFNHKQEDLAQIIGKSRSHISNILRLLTLPEDVKQLIREGKLSFGHARALITSENPSETAKEVVQQSLNVRETEKLVQQQKEPNFRSESLQNEQQQSEAAELALRHVSDRMKRPEDPEIYNLAQQLSTLSGLVARIKLKGRGGEVTFSFSDLQQLDSFIRKLNN